MLTALWLYATVDGVGSARELARLCEEHVAYQGLCGGVSVNHKTLSAFRVDHGAVLERLQTDSFAALLQAGVASVQRVAQDGMRVRASAGAASFRRRSTLQECQREAREAIDRLRTELDSDPAVASRRHAAAQRRAAEDRQPGRGRAGRSRAAAGGAGQGRDQEEAPGQARGRRRADDTAHGRRTQGATGLDDRPRSAGDEDGGWRFPAGL